MNTVIENTQNRLQEIAGLKYVDEDWGQLDYYSPNPPVKWPCVLIDIANASFSDVGKDRSKTPQNRQMGDEVLSLTVADMRLTNSSGRAPLLQKNNARSIWAIMEDIHVKLHGWSATPMSGKFMRRSRQRIRRDDGIQEYRLMYVFSETDA